MRKLARTAITKVAQTLAANNKEAARALPDSKGGETPKQLQTFRTAINTYFTRANGQTETLYSAENWVRIKLVLETAGPVAIGTDSNLEPVLSGRGRLLDTDEEFEAFLPKGTRLYIISETVNRVGVTIEPVPWMEQLSSEIVDVQSGLQAAIAQAAQAIVGAISGLLPGGRAPTSGTGTPIEQMPLPRAGSIPRPLLTPIRRPGRMR
ncbi:MAG TPA: hypothetical protein VFD36_29475 [Kofleriaceae bacterium]|nr:hypothetical protein [Kofleriaceae bacterium]